MNLSKTKNHSINGVTLYYSNDETLQVALTNINAVIVYADKATPSVPIFFQRYCDYIDSVKIKELNLVEAVRPYILNETEYPKCTEYLDKKRRGSI